MTSPALSKSTPLRDRVDHILTFRFGKAARWVNPSSTIFEVEPMTDPELLTAGALAGSILVVMLLNAFKIVRAAGPVPMPARAPGRAAKVFWPPLAPVRR
jgi:hypothetical protein